MREFVFVSQRNKPDPYVKRYQHFTCLILRINKAEKFATANKLFKNVPYDLWQPFIKDVIKV